MKLSKVEVFEYMNDYMKMFNEIIHIMHNDYAGKDEKLNWDEPLIYQQKIEEAYQKQALNDDVFYELVFEYLEAFNDLHILFRDEKTHHKQIGFSVRRYDRFLYITEVYDQDLPLEKGMKITQIDLKDILHYEQKYKQRFLHIHHERQNWNELLKRANTITIQLENQELVEYEILSSMNNQNEPYAVKPIDSNILYFKFIDFCRSTEMNQLLENHQDLISSTPYWIIDVRKNSGGSDMIYYPILPFLFSKGEQIINEETYLLMSDRNCKLRIDTLNEFLKHANHNLETHQMIESYILDIHKNWGKGFIKQAEEKTTTFHETYEYPKKVIILTDVLCSSSGEQFVFDAKQAKKVHLLGRPTLGVLDYSNLAKVKLNEHFTLWYPTSKTANTLSHYFTNEGIYPNTYIPWTPNHINEDVDLLEAINILQNEKNQSKSGGNHAI
jgi:hypothetical protein